MDRSSSASWSRRLRQERTLRNWRQQDLADELGTTTATIKRWERGSQHPSAYFRVKLCALFGMSAEEFGFAEPAPQPLLVSGEAFKGPEFLHAPALQSEALSSDLDEGCSAFVQEPGGQVLKTLPSQRSHQLADRDWKHMLRRLRRSYKELLDQSLHGLVWVELGLSEKPDLVRNVTNLLFRLPQGGERLLALGMGVRDAYDEAEGELLILGEPGAGKSALLVDLAQQLVDQALAGENLLLPVILRLSSWARERPPLADWMIEQLCQTYDIPRHLGERWVNEGRLLPLLDGLDEMEEAARPACIAAINAYHRTHLAPLVVCSRQAEYEGAAQYERLALQNAVIVQPLTNEQIGTYLDAAGPPFAGVRAALHKRQALWELATTPLMLSVLLLTYRGVSSEEIITQEEDLERQVWADYVARQVAEKGNETRYPLKRTRAWLAFLAQQLQMHQQTTFYAEHLDIDWLPNTQQRVATRLTTLIPSIVIGGCVSLFISLFIIGSGDGVFLLQMAMFGGFIGSCLSPSIAREFVDRGRCLHARTARHLRNAVLFGVLVAACFGFYVTSGYYGVSAWLRDGGIFCLGNLLSSWVFQVFLDRRQKQHASVLHSRVGLRHRLMRWTNTAGSPHIWQAGAIFGIGVGLSYELSYLLSYGQEYLGGYRGPDFRLMPLMPSIWLHATQTLGMGFGLSISATTVLTGIILTDAFRALRFAERIRWTWQRLFCLEHLRATLIMTTMAMLFFGLSTGLSEGLNTGLSGGLSQGLSLGLSDGVSLGLTYWLLLGLYQGMKQEHLSDQSRSQFNQGIRRSFRNGLLLSLVSAIIITGMGMLSTGLRLGMSVSDGLSIWLSFGLIILLAGMVVMWTLSGGLTILRHYVIRWSLSRTRTFPFRAAAFLDDTASRILMRRIGGGYSFIHRRLQDYFADTAQPHGAGEERETQ